MIGWGQENLVKQLASNPETQEQALELMASLNNSRDRAAERRQLHGGRALLAGRGLEWVGRGRRVGVGWETAAL